MSFFGDLSARGLVVQLSDPELGAKLDAGGLTAYCGFDPTGPSLHVGSLLQIVGLMRLQRAGHRPIVVVGGATGMIGDPSGKSEERKLLTAEALAENVAGLRSQLGRFLDFSPGRALLVNNFEWFEGVRYLEFLRDVGKHFTVNMMLAKESVRARLEDREHGISYTEFSYMLMQSYDYLWLHDHHGCQLQIGGTDQWGNITAGIDLVRRMRGQAVFGYTQPLITTADGKKFGKTESGTSVWLDGARTSPYQMFQYFLNSDDRDAEKLLKYFTFLPIAEIDEVVAESQRAPEQRVAQRRLAFEVTQLVHGAEAATQARDASYQLFDRAKQNLPRAVGEDADTVEFNRESWEDAALQLHAAELAGAPTSSLSRALLGGDGLLLTQLLSRAEVGLCKSVSDARRQIEQGGIYLNEVRVGEIGLRLTVAHLVEGKFILVRKGKRAFHIVRLVD